MPSNWSKIRDEWLNRTAIAKDDAKWALEALVNSEDELFEIEQRIKNKEDAISQVKILKKKVKLSNISFSISEKIPLRSHWIDSAVSIIVKDYFYDEELFKIKFKL